MMVSITTCMTSYGTNTMTSLELSGGINYCQLEFSFLLIGQTCFCSKITLEFTLELKLNNPWSQLVKANFFIHSYQIQKQSRNNLCDYYCILYRPICAVVEKNGNE